jgi:O-antigen/teichoic acid export membrane protein
MPARRARGKTADPGLGDSSIARGSALLLLAQVLGNAGYFVAVLVLARSLTPAGRGTIAFVTTAVVVVGRVLELGVTQATMVLAAQREEDRPALLANVALFCLAAGASGGCAMGVVFGLAHVGPRLDRAELAAVGAGVLVGSLFDGGYAVLLGLGRLREWTMVAAVMPWIYALSLGAVSAIGSLTILRALVVWVVAHGCWAVAAFLLARRYVPLGRPRLELLRESLSLGIRAWLGSLSRFLNFRLDQIILGLLATQATLGIYAIAVNLSEVPLYLPGAVATAAIPAIARARPDRRVDQALTSFRVLFLITFATVVVACAGAPLLPFIFGDAYRASVVPYLWLLPGALGYAASGVLSSALLSSGRPFLSSLGPLVSLVSGVALDFALIPSLGATGAAVAASAAFVAGGTVACVAYRSVARFAWASLVPGMDDARLALGWLLAVVRRVRGSRPRDEHGTDGRTARRSCGGAQPTLEDRGSADA